MINSLRLFYCCQIKLIELESLSQSASEVNFSWKLIEKQRIGNAESVFVVFLFVCVQNNVKIWCEKF